MLDGVRGLCTPPELAAGVERFIEDHPLPAGGRTVEQTVERLGVNAAFAVREGPTVADALTAALGPART
jgi:hypothetical protein